MKYRFEVVYRNQSMKKASEFLKYCDIDLGDIGIKEVFTFTSNSGKSISQIKEDLRKSFELCDLELMHVEGGTVE